MDVDLESANIVGKAIDEDDEVVFTNSALVNNGITLVGGPSSLNDTSDSPALKISNIAYLSTSAGDQLRLKYHHSLMERLVVAIQDDDPRSQLRIPLEDLSLISDRPEPRVLPDLACSFLG